MKSFWFIISFLTLIVGTTVSQTSRAYCTHEITWFGLDYSQAYFIDDDAFPDPMKLKGKLFLEWNNFVFKEPKKFDIARAFNKIEVINSTSYINNRNNNIDIKNRVGNFWIQDEYINDDSIQNIVNSYKLDESSIGVGLVFIVESYNKPTRNAKYWVTFFDINTKEVLLTEKIVANPSGTGIRNFWANSFYNALIKAEQSMGFVF